MPWHTIQNILRIAKRNFFAYVKVKTIQSFRSHLQGPRSILTLEERTETLSQNVGNSYTPTPHNILEEQIPPHTLLHLIFVTPVQEPVNTLSVSLW